MQISVAVLPYFWRSFLKNEAEATMEEWGYWESEEGQAPQRKIVDVLH